MRRFSGLVKTVGDGKFMENRVSKS